MRISWQRALKNVLDLLRVSEVEGKLWQHRWAVGGSGATALQGVNIVPNDIDILAHEPAGVFGFAELLSSYAPAHCDYMPGDEHWVSSKEMPVQADSKPDEYGMIWHFARWYLDGFKVEVAHIAPPSGFPRSGQGIGIWENGPEIWDYIHTVPFEGYQVPVIPLEIQLETCLSRELQERIDGILAVFDANGYQTNLLHQSLSSKNLKTFENLAGNRRDN